MDSKTVNRLYANLSRSLPDPRTELIYNNHFELLISVLLSAQATDRVVNQVTPLLFSRYPDPKSILACGEIQLKKIIQPIGLAPTKAKNVLRVCRILLDEYDGEVPDQREALENLPGVGRKTANVVLNEAFDQPTIAVDTHVFRVANRTGLAPGTTALKTEMKLLEVTQKKWLKNAHHYLLLHGRYICKAKNFNCDSCVIKQECQFSEKVFNPS